VTSKDCRDEIRWAKVGSDDMRVRGMGDAIVSGWPGGEGKSQDKGASTIGGGRFRSGRKTS
jgi:hypothetical protein